MPLPYKRSARIEQLIQQTVSKIVMELADLDSELVTITDVRLTEDLLNCRIYYSVFGLQVDKEKTDKILKKNIGKIRHQLALRINLRNTPLISFFYDDTNQNATKVFDILKKIEEEKK